MTGSVAEEGWGWEDVGWDSAEVKEQPHISAPSTLGCTDTPACSHSAQRSRPSCTPAAERLPAVDGRC